MVEWFFEYNLQISGIAFLDVGEAILSSSDFLLDKGAETNACAPMSGICFASDRNALKDNWFSI